MGPNQTVLVRKLQPATIISGRLGGGVETDYMSTGDNVIPSTVIRKDWEVPATLNNTRCHLARF